MPPIPKRYPNLAAEAVIARKALQGPHAPRLERNTVDSAQRTLRLITEQAASPENRVAAREAFGHGARQHQKELEVCPMCKGTCENHKGDTCKACKGSGEVRR